MLYQLHKSFCGGAKSEIPPRLIRQHRQFGALLALVLIMASCLTQAQPLLLTELPKGSLGTRADLLVEEGTPISLEEAQTRQREGMFHQGDKSILSYGIGARPLWVHLEVINPTVSSLPFKMVAGMTWIDRLSIFVVHDNQTLNNWQTGDEHHTPQGLTPAVGFTFALNFPPGRSDLYLRAESIAPLVLPIELMTEEEALSNESLVKYSHGLLYGYLIALIAYNIMLEKIKKPRRCVPSGLFDWRWLDLGISALFILHQLDVRSHLL